MKPQGTKPQAKTKIEPKMESVIQVKMPMVRNFSTGGGHAPGDTIIEGEEKIVTKKWQGYPPQNLNIIGKPMPPLAEVSIPRFLGKAEYASRILLPNMLHARVLVSPHPHARIKGIDTAVAEKMPGVAYVLSYKNAPPKYPLPTEVGFQGEIIAIVAADTEDQAEDAVEAINVDYELLPVVATLNDVMSPGAPDLRNGKGNLILVSPTDPHYDPKASWVAHIGDIEQGFAQADIIKEYTYRFGGATAVPIQPWGCAAKWDGDKLTFWGMGQGVFPSRQTLATALQMDVDKIHFINKYNGCTLGAAMLPSRFNPYIAYVAKMANRPVRLMLLKEQELAQLAVKPENMVKFKVGVKKDGHITGLLHEIHISAGDTEAGGAGATSEISKNQTELYTTKIPHWKSIWYSYKTNVIRLGAVRSNTQQEVKWSWENFMDELSGDLGMDPIQFRMLHISRPGDKITKAWHSDFGAKYEAVDGGVTYDAFPSVEVLEEGAKAIGWDKRNPKPGAGTGRFKRGIGLGMSQHHPGHMGYHEGEIQFEKLTAGGQANNNTAYGASVEITTDGHMLMRSALPDSGTNHDTALATVAAEILGYTSRDPVRVIWGDTDTGPQTNMWNGGHTITLQGAAVFSAADKLRKDLLKRASDLLKVDPSKLDIKDTVITAKDDPKKRTTFAALVAANKGPIRQNGRGAAMGQGRGLVKGTGTCFVEVEVDTWTGDWKFLRSVYVHDTGLVVNPLVGEADMHGSIAECFQMSTESLPYDREFAGTRHYSVGYLSYRIPTIMDVPEQQTQVFIDSLEPRWFYGIKSFSETTIGAVPGALSNAIYNACGVRVREHPITRDKIMAGLKAMKRA